MLSIRRLVEEGLRLMVLLPLYVLCRLSTQALSGLHLQPCLEEPAFLGRLDAAPL